MFHYFYVEMVIETMICSLQLLNIFCLQCERAINCKMLTATYIILVAQTKLQLIFI